MPISQLFAPTEIKQKTYTIGEATFRMIELPGEKGFWMGEDGKDEHVNSWSKPRHRRDIYTFALAEFLVTQKLWEAVVIQARIAGVLSEYALPLEHTFFRGSSRPVEGVNWRQTQKFCEVLSLLTVDKPEFFRLPSEAEWEYAAKGGRRTTYSGSNILSEVGWYDNDDECVETMPVGMLSSNDYGFYDLSGNVWEWCDDHWHHNFENHPLDGQAWIDSSSTHDNGRVARGGYSSKFFRGSSCSSRAGAKPAHSEKKYGFRLASPV